jgi:hypothetical protein
MTADDTDCEFTKPGITITLMEHSASVGTLPISWCFTKEAAAEVAKHPKSCVMICAHPLGEYTHDCSYLETRTIARSKESIGFISFNRPGKHRIFVITSHKDCSWARTRLGNRWEATPLRCNQDGSVKVQSNEYICYDYIDVDIPAECFAPDPPEWEKRWVNFFFPGSRALDQCQFRRRRILAYTVQPIILGVMILAMWFARLLLFTILKLSLLKDIKFRPVFDTILGSGFRKIFDVKDGDVDNTRSYLDFLLPVPFSILAVWVMYGTIALTVFVDPLFFLIPFALLALVGLIFVLVIIIQNSRPIGEALGKVIDFIESVYLKIFPPLKEEDLAKELLVCDEVKPIRRIQDLPKGKRTLKVRFNELKVQVCKPFST